MNLKEWITKEQVDKLGFYKIKILHLSEDTREKNERTTWMKWGRYFQTIADKKLYLEYTKDS